MIARFLHWLGWRPLLYLILLLITLGSMVWGLSSVVRGIDGNLITVIIAIGLITIMLLTRHHQPSGWPVVVLGISGITGSIYYFAALSNPLLAILRTLGAIPNALLQAQRWPELTPLALAWHQLIGQGNTLFLRIGMYVTALLQGEAVVDPLVITMLWGLVIWFITMWAGWGIFRLRRPLPAVAPALILLAGTLNYTRGDPIWLIPIIAAALLLMALGGYDLEERYWHRNLIDYAEDIRIDMLTIVPLLVIGLTLLASFMPSFTIKQIVEFAREIIEPHQSQVETIADSLGINQPPPVPGESERLRSPGLPQQHLLSGGPELSQQIMMVIQTGDLPPMSSMEVLPHPPAQYYWRSLTYDVYTGRGWTTTPTETIKYSARQPLLTDLPVASPVARTVNQVVKFVQDRPGVLYATGLLISADVDIDIFWRTPLGEIADAFGATTEADSYTASSLLTTPSIRQLRAARPVYPDWVLSRYLNLPESLPERVRYLAIELTRGQLTPYDQTAAIEAYLRGFPYSLDVPNPPPNQDVVDFFLFDLQQGYCDYYATAMVVLSRAAGIPARLVSGYGSGSYDPPNARYVVTAANAHSWVEIYFSGIGWVEFEPTAGLPAIERNPGQAASPLAFPEPKPVQHFNYFQWLMTTSWFAWLLALAGCILAGITSWYIFDIWRLNRLPPQRAISTIYQHLNRQGEQLAVGRQAGDTPIEYTFRMRTTIQGLITAREGRTVLQSAIGEIDLLVQLYNQAAYSPHPINPSQHTQAIHTWLHLRWRLLIARLRAPHPH